MSFTVTVKEEISKHDSTRSEMIAELSAYIRNNGSLYDDKITITTENVFIVDLIINRVKELFGFTPKKEVIENLNFSKKELYQVTINQKETIMM